MNKKIIDIPLKSMIRECSLNPNLSFEHFNNIAYKNRDNIHDTFRNRKFNNDFVSYITVYGDENHFMAGFMPSYDHFLDQLILLLNANVPSNIQDEKELSRILLERVDVLKGITNAFQLRYEFPLLYCDLIDGRKFYDGIQYLKKKNPERYEYEEHYYYSCGLKKNLQRFITTQGKMYERYVKKRNELKKKYDNTRFNNYIIKNFDLNKLSMFVVHEYLCACETSNDRAEINRYLEKIEMYIKDNRLDKNVVIHTDSGVEINYELILKRTHDIKKRLKENDSTVNWVLIPRDRDYSGVKKDSTTKTKRTLMNQKEIEALHKVGIAKNSFYEKTNYKAKVAGLGKYKGYIGYIYDNGKVILDMEYDDNRPHTAKGNAIFVMSVCDFEELSKQSKRILQKDTRVKRHCHVNNWQDKITDLIKEEATENDKQNTNALIKRLKRKALY